MSTTYIAEGFYIGHDLACKCPEILKHFRTMSWHGLHPARTLLSVSEQGIWKKNNQWRMFLCPCFRSIWILLPDWLLVFVLYPRPVRHNYHLYFSCIVTITVEERFQHDFRHMELSGRIVYLVNIVHMMLQLFFLMQSSLMLLFNQLHYW